MAQIHGAQIAKCHNVHYRLTLTLSMGFPIATSTGTPGSLMGLTNHTTESHVTGDLRGHGVDAGL